MVLFNSERTELALKIQFHTEDPKGKAVSSVFSGMALELRSSVVPEQAVSIIERAEIIASHFILFI